VRLLDARNAILATGLWLGVVVYAAVTTGCSSGRTLASSHRPNVILITIDTLRRDHVSCYGQGHQTTPFLDRLATQAVRFDRAYSTSSWTVPSVVSMLTSLYSMTHGVRYGYVATTGQVLEQPILGADLELLPEILHDHGYQTFGVTANEHLRGKQGFARGFDRYTCVGFESGVALEEPLREIRARIDSSRPYFLWVHYFDPHMPYDSNRPELLGYLDGVPKVDADALGRVQSLASSEEFQALDLRDNPDAVAYARASYDSDVRLADSFVEDLFDLFEIDPDDLVLVTSDHGEEFYEHHAFGHGHALFEELLRIPLIVRLPGSRHAGRVVGERVSLIDVLPTILDVAGIEPPSPIHGSSMLPLLESGGGEDHVVYASTAKVDEVRAVMVGSLKMIQPVGYPEQAMLFDLEQDPGEQRNVADERPEELRELRRVMALLRMSRQRPGVPLDALPVPPERLEALRSLGYVR